MSNVVKSKLWFENVWKGSTPKIIPFHRWNTMKTSEHHPNIVQKYVQKWLKVIEFVQNKSCLVVTVSEWLKLRSFTSFFMLFMFFPSPVTKRHVCLQQDGWSAGCAHQVLQDTASSMRLVVLHHPFSWLSIIHVYIYRGSRLGVPRSFEEPSVLMLYQKGRSCIQMGGWGGWGGCNNVMWSALDDVESWKMLLGWKMLPRWFRCCLQKGGWGGVGGV